MKNLVYEKAHALDDVAIELRKIADSRIELVQQVSSVEGGSGKALLEDRPEHVGPSDEATRTLPASIGSVKAGRRERRRSAALREP